MKDRFKYIREHVPGGKLTQPEFGRRIGIGRDAVANIEGGRVYPADVVIKAVCREFGVNRFWLETGEGEPFEPKTKEDLIKDAFGEVLSTSTSKSRLIRAMATLPDDAYPILEDAIVRIAEEIKKDSGQK